MGWATDIEQHVTHGLSCMAWVARHDCGVKQAMALWDMVNDDMAWRSNLVGRAAMAAPAGRRRDMVGARKWQTGGAG